MIWSGAPAPLNWRSRVISAGSPRLCWMATSPCSPVRRVCADWRPRRLRRRRGPAAYLPCRVGARLRRLDGWLANLVHSVARLLVPVCQCCPYRLGLVGEAQANTAGAAPTAFAAARVVRRSPQPHSVSSWLIASSISERNLRSSGRIAGERRYGGAFRCGRAGGKVTGSDAADCRQQRPCGQVGRVGSS